MKIWISIMLALVLQRAFSQTTIPVSSTGIGELKINMTLAQVEKITGQTISLKAKQTESYDMDTIVVTYKGIQVTIELITEGDDPNPKLQKKIYSIKASHPGLQTRSGFTLGSDKFEIVKKLDGMYLTLQPDWRMDTKPDKTKYSVLMLSDGENGTMLTMFFEDNKLTGFLISVDEGC